MQRQETIRLNLPRQHRLIDAVWSVMTAAVDFGDEAMITICRRVIDARLSGASPMQCDLSAIDNFWTN